MRTPTDPELARHRVAIEHVLRRHRDSEAVQWAIKLVERELLQYRATSQYTYDTYAERKLNLLRDRGAHAMDVLQRVVECFSLRREGEPSLDSPRAFNAWLARKVLTLKRPVMLNGESNAFKLSHIGQLIGDLLGRFAAATLMQVDKCRAERKAFDAACEDYASETAKTILRTRHGRTRSAEPKPSVRLGRPPKLVRGSGSSPTR